MLPRLLLPLPLSHFVRAAAHENTVDTGVALNQALHAPMAVTQQV